VGGAGTLAVSNGANIFWTVLTDGYHGNRGGGALHSIVTNSAAGFVPQTTATRALLSDAAGVPFWGQISDGYISGVAWGKISGTPTTISGYGITDGVTTARTISTNAPLSGGGDLSSNRTLSVATVSNISSGVVPSVGSAGTLAISNGSALFWAALTDGYHGNRGGGSLHAAVTNTAAGFAVAVGAVGTVLTSTGTAATWQAPAAGLPAVTVYEETSTVTTSSLTDVVVNTSMTLTPAAGTYEVWFSGSVSHNSNGESIFISIYSNGLQVAASERRYNRGNQATGSGFTCMAKVTVSGAQAIDGRWRTTAATATMYQRQLHIMKIS
jgi:hypothetical protein